MFLCSERDLSGKSLSIIHDCTAIKGLETQKLRRRWGSTLSICQETDFCHYNVWENTIWYASKKYVYKTNKRNITTNYYFISLWEVLNFR